MVRWRSKMEKETENILERRAGVQSERRNSRGGKQELLGILGKGEKELRMVQRGGKEGLTYNPRVNNFQTMLQHSRLWSGVDQRWEINLTQPHRGQNCQTELITDSWKTWWMFSLTLSSSTINCYIPWHFACPNLMTLTCMPHESLFCWGNPLIWQKVSPDFTLLASNPPRYGWNVKKLEQ